MPKGNLTVEPAFPQGNMSPINGAGMTLRAYIATEAMAAIIGKHEPLKPRTPPGESAEWDVPRLTAIGAVAYADALIAELDK